MPLHRRLLAEPRSLTSVRARVLVALVSLLMLAAVVATDIVIAILATAIITEVSARILTASNDARRALVASLTSFTADASHELRAPLATLQNVLEVALTRPHTASEYRATIEVALESSRRITDLTNALLILARGDAGALHVAAVPVDVSDLLEEVRTRHAAAAEVAGVSIEVDAEPGEVAGERQLLSRMLDNLVENALRHTPRGGRITLAAALGERACDISVADTGPGVPQSERQRIFERFSRIDPGRDRRDGGTGLGLAVCRAVCEAHGGLITLEPSVTGARFAVRLPVAMGSR